MPVDRAGVGTTVTSGEITDLTITNADIATNAAIAGSKLADDYDRDNGQAGILTGVSAYGAALLSVVVPANRGWYARFVPSRTMAITKVAFVNTVAAGSDDAVDVGIYSAAGAKITTSGATAGKLNAAAGLQTVTITSTPLTAGTVYYAALSTGAVGSTPASLAMHSLGGQLYQVYKAFGTTLGLAEWDWQGSAHPLPTTAVLGGGINEVPFMALRES